MAISKIKVGSTEHELQTTIANVDGLQPILDATQKRFDSTVAHYYGTCDTASTDAAKVVTISDFELAVGVRVTVKFTNATGTDAEGDALTMNVSGTGALPMCRYGATAMSTGTTTTGWTAGAIQTFTYDGAAWVREYWNNTTYSNVSLGQGYATCSTAAATKAKTASLSSYSLVAGGIVSVRFSYDVPAGATLNINSKGAKAIYYNNAAITDGVIKAGDTATFIYSTYYRLIAIDKGNTVTADRALISNSSGKMAASAVTATELGYLDGVTSNIQTQLNAKAASSNVYTKSEVDAAITSAIDGKLSYVDVDRISMPTSGLWSYITYGNGKFVATANSKDIVAYSIDGITWEQTTLPSSMTWKVTYGNDKFVAVAEDSSIAAYSTDGITWTQTSLPSSASWNSIAYGNGVFVTVADAYSSKKAAYSTDGVTWAASTLPSGAYWGAVAYGNGKFVAIPAKGYSNSIAAHSTDGITWTQTSLPVKAMWYSVTYGDGKFVAVTYGSVAAYSTDGITWTETTLPFDCNWCSVTHGNGKFVTIAANNYVAYSEDGTTWNSTYLPIENLYWRYVGYGNGRFVAIGGTGDFSLVAYSDDGIVWNNEYRFIYQNEVDVTDSFVDVIADKHNHTSAILSPAGNAVLMPSKLQWQSVTYGDDKFVAIAGTGKNVAAYSTDGITWTQTTLPASNYWDSVVYGDGKFVAITGSGYARNVTAYSTDGIAWTQGSLPTAAKWSSMTYGGGKFVAIAQNDGIAAHSTDGITWTQTSLPSSASWYSVTYGGDKFVAVAVNNNVAAYSTDGITWTQTTLPINSGWYSVTYGGGKFVATIGNATSNIAAYSADGITWEQTTLPNENTWKALTYGNGKFVTISFNAAYLYEGTRWVAAYSTDGITWTQTTLPIGAGGIECLIYGNDKFVGIGGGQSSSETIVYSLDGILWYSNKLAIVQDNIDYTNLVVDTLNLATKQYVDNSKEVFIATYGTTTFAEITDALNAGKACFAYYDHDDEGGIFSFSGTYTMYSGSTEIPHYMFSRAGSGYSRDTMYFVGIGSDNVWDKQSKRFLSSAGGTMTGALTLASDPTSAMHAATKQYVDSNTGVFVATYGTTTYAEVKAALEAGKFCFCNYNNTYILPLVTQSDTHLWFSMILQSTSHMYSLDNTNRWSSQTEYIVRRSSDGILYEKLVANPNITANLSTKQVRNILAGTDDLQAGVSELAIGDIYVVYE